MTIETPEQRYRRAASKIADSVTYAINVQKMGVQDAIGAIFKKKGHTCCPLGAVESMLSGRTANYYPTPPEAADLLNCEEAEACAFIIGFEGVYKFDELSVFQARGRFPKWVALGEAYRKRFVATP